MTHDEITETIIYADTGNADAALALTAELQAFAAKADRNQPNGDWNRWKGYLEHCQKMDRWPMVQVYAQVALRAEFARRARTADAQKFI